MNDPGIHITFHEDHDAFCASCAYNLRGVSGSACPECGAPFRVALPQAQARYALYLVGLLSTFGIALGVFSLLFWLILTARGVFSIVEQPIQIVYGLINLIAIVCLALLLVYRDRITRAGKKTRLWIAIPPAVILGGYLIYSLSTAFKI